MEGHLGVATEVIGKLDDHSVGTCAGSRGGSSSQEAALVLEKGRFGTHGTARLDHRDQMRIAGLVGNDGQAEIFVVHARRLDPAGHQNI
jgi:hypothetical protein